MKLSTKKCNLPEYMEPYLIANDPLWTGSEHENWERLGRGQDKGAIGTEIVMDFLRDEWGCEVSKISDEGDIMLINERGEEERMEVKTATSKLKPHVRTDFVNVELWFNQIRPKQKGWSWLALVGVYPNHIRIWIMSRKDWDRKHKLLKSIRPGHTGTEDLMEVRLIKNTKTNTFLEWDEYLVRNDQDGNAL